MNRLSEPFRPLAGGCIRGCEWAKVGSATRLVGTVNASPCQLMGVACWRQGRRISHPGQVGVGDCHPGEFGISGHVERFSAGTSDLTK